MRNYKLAPFLAVATALVSPILARAEDEIVKLVSAANGKCLQPINGSHNQGDPVVQETCDGSLAQQWVVHSADYYSVHLINRASGLCLDARGKAVNGTPIQQWPCNRISNEKWGFGITNNELGSGVSNDPWSHCIAVPGNQDGLPMELRFCDGDISQIWLRPNG